MKGKRDYRLVVASFFLPLLIMCAAFAALKITPFGENTLLISDAHYYFINYLSYFRSVLEGKHSLFYSFSNGIGGNITYFTCLYLLRPDIIFYEIAGWDYLPEAYSASALLAYSLCGLTMYMLISDIHGDKISNLIFSTSYALMGFNVVYNYDINFHPGPIMLPLMVMGLKKIFEGKSAVLYEVSIAYTLLTSFQMGYILCFSSVLFFGATMIMGRNNLENKKKIVIRYMIASLLGGGLSSFGWIPAFLSTTGKMAENNVDHYAFIDNGPILQMAARFFSGAASVEQIINGYPLLFCGILTIALVILFFMNEKIAVEVKCVIGSLVSLFVLSFYIQTFAAAFQGFTGTAWFNFRHSFVLCFVMLLIAAQEFEYLDEIKESDVKKVFWILLLASLIIFSTKYEFVDGGMVVADFCILLLIGLSFLFYKRCPERADRKSLVLMCLLCVCFQLYFNYYFSDVGILKYWQKTETEMQNEILERQPLVFGAQEMDKDFYRMEIEDQRTWIYGNDAFMFHYNGVGHTSYNSVDINKGLSKLGISWCAYKSNSYDRGVPAATDSFLGIRYVISKNDLAAEKNYEKLVDMMGIGLYRNTYALPVAILCNDEIDDMDIFDDKDIFSIQNKLWKNMTGMDKEVFSAVREFNVSSHNIYDSITETSGYIKNAYEPYKIKDTDLDEEADNVKKYDSAGNEIKFNKPYIEVSFTATKDGPVYMYDSSAVDENSGTLEDVVKFLGVFRVGDEVTGRIYFDYDIDQRILGETVSGLYIYYENLDVLKSCSDELLNRGMSLHRLNDRYLIGKSNCDESKRLLLTIPYDKGWKVYLDGTEVKPEKTLGFLMSIKVPEGEHSYELKYYVPGLRLGIIICLMAILASIIENIITLKSIGLKKQQQ